MRIPMIAPLNLVLVLFIGSFLASSAVAQDTTATAQDTTLTADELMDAPQDSMTVEWVISEAPDDAPVILRGRLVETVDDQFYRFEDETGSILVKIGDEVFGADEFEAGVEVEIAGEVDKDEGEDTAIDVEHVRVI